MWFSIHFHVLGPTVSLYNPLIRRRVSCLGCERKDTPRGSPHAVFPLGTDRTSSKNPKSLEDLLNMTQKLHAIGFQAVPVTSSLPGRGREMVRMVPSVFYPELELDSCFATTGARGSNGVGRGSPEPSSLRAPWNRGRLQPSRSNGVAWKRRFYQRKGVCSRSDRWSKNV